MDRYKLSLRSRKRGIPGESIQEALTISLTEQEE